MDVKFPFSAAGMAAVSQTMPAKLWVQPSGSVARPWAHLSRSWGGHRIYRCCFILSLSPVIMYIYIYHLIVFLGLLLLQD